MKRAIEKAKANPLATTILTLLLGSGVTGGMNYDSLVSFVTLPQRIEVIEARQKMDIIQRFRRGELSLDEFVAIMYPNLDSVAAMTGGGR